MSRVGTRSSETFDMDDLPPGSYLLSGPAYTGKLDFGLQFLSPTDESATAGLVVSTKTNATAICDQLSDLYTCTDTAPSGVTDSGYPETLFRDYTVLDCVSGSGAAQIHPTAIASVPTPGDLTKVGIRLSSQLQRLRVDRRTQTRLYYDALSTVLMYADTRTVFKFLHVLRARLQEIDATGLFSIDPTMHEEQTVQTLAQATDGMIEVRRDSTFEIRAVGIPEVPDSWTEIK